MKANLALAGYYYAGKMDLVYPLTEESIRISEESGDIYSKAWAYTIHGASCYGKGLLTEAEKYLLMGGEYCEKINLISLHYFTKFNLGEIYFDTRDFSKSKQCYEKSSLLLDSIRIYLSWSNLGKVGLARSKVMNKEKDVNLESLYAHSRNNKMKVTEGWIQRYIGEILLHIDDQHLSEAEHWIQKALEADQRNRMMFHLGKDHALYADWFKKKGDIQGVKEQLTKAIDLFKECGADGSVTKTEQELASLT